ncbi:hypothetical protein Tco_0138883 [Tanacetum coccineum]
MYLGGVTTPVMWLQLWCVFGSASIFAMSASSSTDNVCDEDTYAVVRSCQEALVLDFGSVTYVQNILSRADYDSENKEVKSGICVMRLLSWYHANTSMPAKCYSLHLHVGETDPYLGRASPSKWCLQPCRADYHPENEEVKSGICVMRCLNNVDALRLGAVYQMVTHIKWKKIGTKLARPWRPVMLRRLFQTGSDLPKGSARKALFGEEEKDERPWRPVMLRRLFQTGSDLPKGSARKALFGEEEKDERTKSVKRIKHDD